MSVKAKDLLRKAVPVIILTAFFAVWVYAATIGPAGIVDFPWINGTSLSVTNIYGTGRREVGSAFNVTDEIDTNWEWSGETVLLEASWNVSVSQGKLVYLDTNGTLRNTDADASESVPCIGITVEAITAGNYGTVLVSGWIYNSAWTLDEGRDVYVSTNAGEATPTIPSGSGDQVQVIGIGVTEDLLYFNPDFTILEIV